MPAIGIDLGTFRSVMVSSDSHEEEELTVIGTPKDPIAKNFLKRDFMMKRCSNGNFAFTKADGRTKKSNQRPLRK